MVGGASILSNAGGSGAETPHRRVQTQQTDPSRGVKMAPINLPNKKRYRQCRSKLKDIHPTTVIVRISSNDVDAVVGFLENKGFDESAAKSQDPYYCNRLKLTE